MTETLPGSGLRVLHIGNIANNAYNNAKIQRRFGIEADVLSFDYYHIMACPEWEDADFAGEVGDPMYPDWWAVDLKGFERPRWFAQGPFDASLRYLLAKSGSPARAGAAWRWLQFERWMLCRATWQRRAVRIAIMALTGSRISFVVAPANAVLWRWAGTWLARAGNVRGLRRLPLMARIRHRGRHLLRKARTADVVADAPRHLRAMQRYLPQVQQCADRELAALGRNDRFEDIAHFYRVWYHPYLATLFDRYDVIQCYATYTAMPFILGRTDYVAYEHGTIRSIPFAETDEGRMCLASYREAAAVLVTNTDNIEAVRRLDLDRDRVVYLPHAFDSDKLARFARDNPPVPRDQSARTVFLTPTRQHWVDQDPGWAKGNDRVLEALRIVKQSGRDCVLRAVAWGNDLEASRQRIAEYGIGDMVEWIPTMKKRQLWHAYLAADAVVDQFVVPALGGVTFEAMMLGRRVISSIDAPQAEEFFGRAPPLYNCRTPDEIAEAMARVIDDRDDSRGDGAANAEWMETYHSAERIVRLQMQVYNTLRRSRPASARPASTSIAT